MVYDTLLYAGVEARYFSIIMLLYNVISIFKGGWPVPSVHISCEIDKGEGAYTFW